MTLAELKSDLEKRLRSEFDVVRHEVKHDIGVYWILYGEFLG